MSTANGVGVTWSAPTKYQGPTDDSTEQDTCGATRFYGIEPIAAGAPKYLRVFVDKVSGNCTRFVVAGLPLEVGYHTHVRLKLTLPDGDYHAAPTVDAGQISFKIRTKDIPLHQVLFQLEVMRVAVETTAPAATPVWIPRPAAPANIPVSERAV
jgi:hypothetical protein